MTSDELVARAIATKARRYLRNAVIIFSASLVLLATIAVVIENQHVQARKDFVLNDNMHFIEVTPAAGAGRLTFADADRIGQVVKTSEASGWTLTAKYELGIGIPDDTGTDRFLYGLDGPDAARLLGLASAEPGVLYAQASPAQPDVTLHIPTVTSSSGGMSGGAATARTLALRGGVADDSPLRVVGRGDDSQALYAAGSTFTEIASLALGTPWTEVTKRYDADNPYGIEVLSAYYVHVPDLGDVDSVARALEDEGLTVRYALRAFEDLDGSLTRSGALWALVGILIALASLVHIVLTFRAFMRVSHKDVGILRHYGFTPDRIGRLYRGLAARRLVPVAAAAAAYGIVLGLVAGGSALVPLMAANVVGLAAMTIAVYLLISAGIIAPTVRKDVLALLKTEKDFE